MITLVVASDNHYVPHLAALIESIKDSLADNVSFELFILDGGISKNNQHLLQKQFDSLLKIQPKLHWIDCTKLYQNIAVRDYFSTATFYRLGLDRLLPNHQRVIYLDCDTIVQGDLAELWQTDLKGCVIGAVTDLIMKHMVNQKTPSTQASGAKPADVYLRDTLKMGELIDNYFQAGVLLLDLEQLRALNLEQTMIKDLQSQSYWFLDQDILNKYFLGKVHFLDSRWNVVNSAFDILSSLHESWQKKLEQDAQNPGIIHYAGFEPKPWNNPEAPFAYAYWFYLRRTFWYESVKEKKIFQTLSVSQSLDKKRGVFYKLARKIWRLMPVSVKTKLVGLAQWFVKTARR